MTLTPVRYGTVTATFVDPPEGLQVRFRPDLRQPIVRLTTVSPPLTFALDEITATIDVDGQLLDPDGTPGVRLLADPDLEPSAWTWHVRISSPTTAAVDFSVAISAGATVDLSTVVPVPPDLGAALADWLQAVAAVNTARDAALAAITSTTAGPGNDPAFQFTQTDPSAQWTIPHAFGRRPDVDVYLTSGELVITDVSASATQVVVTFPTPTAGYAVLT